MMDIKKMSDIYFKDAEEYFNKSNTQSDFIRKCIAFIDKYYKEYSKSFKEVILKDIDGDIYLKNSIIQKIYLNNVILNKILTSDLEVNKHTVDILFFLNYKIKEDIWYEHFTKNVIRFLIENNILKKEENELQD